MKIPTEDEVKRALTLALEAEYEKREITFPEHS